MQGCSSLGAVAAQCNLVRSACAFGACAFTCAQLLLIDGTYSEDTVHAGSFNVTAPAGVGFGKVVIGILQPAFEGGSIYFDNVAMRAVPAPGALALLGLAGFAARRRRN